MNKRQIKKRNKIIKERMNFFAKHTIFYSRQCGKTSLTTNIYKTCLDKKYKNFKMAKKLYKDMFIAIDWSNGADHSVKVKYKIKNGVASVLSSERIN